MRAVRTLFLLFLLFGFSFEAMALLECEKQSISSSLIDDGEPFENHESEEHEGSDSDLEDKISSSIFSMDSDFKNNPTNSFRSQNEFFIFLERWQRPPRFI